MQNQHTINQWESLIMALPLPSILILLLFPLVEVVVEIMPSLMPNH
jgi:hypothetical protein